MHRVQGVRTIPKEGAKLSLKINGVDEIGFNPNRNKQHAFHFTADNCIGCHAKAGGGDNVKHGDIADNLRNTTREYDVHMGTDGGDMDCVECHEVMRVSGPDSPMVDHGIGGMAYHSVDDGNMKGCTDCHGGGQIDWVALGWTADPALDDDGILDGTELGYVAQGSGGGGTEVDGDTDTHYVGCDAYTTRAGPDCDDAVATCTNDCTTDTCDPATGSDREERTLEVASCADAGPTCLAGGPYDAECTGASDNDEASFGTGIPGDNKDPCKQDCFFDGNSGSGDDGCTTSVIDDVGNPHVAPTPPADHDTPAPDERVSHVTAEPPNGSLCRSPPRTA